MSTREFFATTMKVEVPKFVRVLKAVPADKASYRPHPSSASAADIAWLLAAELADACAVIDKGEVNYVATPAPASVADSVAAYEKNAAAVEDRLTKLDDAAWKKRVKFMVNGQAAWESELGEMLFGFLFDAIHHRGQLSAYLRPMGAKVPSIYGPSGDDPGA